LRLARDGFELCLPSGYCGLNVILSRPSGSGPTFDEPVPIVDRSPALGIFAVADINRDGKPDVIFIEGNYINGAETSALDILLNETTSSPSFRLVRHLQVGKRLISVAVGDFNHDGWPDIVAVDAADGTLTFLLNDRQWKSNGAFRVHSSFTVMPNPKQILVIDRPGSGLPELLLRNQNVAAIVQ
jgi:hypothetical protein